MAEMHSTYQWVLSQPNNIYVKDIQSLNKNIIATAEITNINRFAIIAGEYQIKVNVTYELKFGKELNKEVFLTCKIPQPKLCTNGEGSYKIEIHLDGALNNNETFISGFYEDNSFAIKEGIIDTSNDYLYILEMPKLITSLTIDENPPIKNKYVEGSAIPINEIGNISTIDFHNITISTIDNPDIFSKLSDPSKNGVTIKTNKLSIPELTVVNLPDSDTETIYICKSKSKNNGITFKMSNPDSTHFGYVMYIQGQKAAGYNSVWIKRDTLDKMFSDMPADIMSTTQKFEYTSGFQLCKLTYEEVSVSPENYLNNDAQTFDDREFEEFKNTLAPTYYKGTINESISDVIRSNNMVLKNIEFVKFGDKVIKLNYEPLSEAQNQSI